MRFLVNECTGPGVARWLRANGHDVISIHERNRGALDEDILAIAVSEERIVVTNDKDFGERVFRDGLPHRGIILLRLADERTVISTRTLSRLLDIYTDELMDRFIVVTESTVRFAGGSHGVM